MSDAAETGQSTLEGRLRFEALLADLSSEFVNIDASLVDTAIEDALRRIAELLNLDRGALAQLDGETVRFTHYWARDGFPVSLVSADAAQVYPTGFGRIMSGEVYCLTSADELAPGAGDRERLLQSGTLSILALPLVVSARVIGGVAFSTTREERTWDPAIVGRLRLIADVFAGALARKRAEVELRAAVEENARLRDRLVEENIYLQHEMRERHGPFEILGQSAAIQRLLAEVEQVASTKATVLLLGETGTGKELVATAIHERSARATRPMVRVNCAAIPAALIESELFGREKGAYTGADTRQAGRFELADGSSIFLDEIGELSAEMQVKLLRVLQERQVERLGSARPIRIDVRVVAATNRDLDQMVAEGTFREDLYYRLNVFPIRVPPLRERPEDIPTLVWAFLDEFSRTFGRRIESVPKEQMAALQRYPWPGNVRELRNTVERAVIVSKGPRLTIAPPAARARAGHGLVRMSDVERDHILSVLARTGWRVRGAHGAAEQLGLKPSTLEGRMARLQIRRPRP